MDRKGREHVRLGRNTLRKRLLRYDYCFRRRIVSFDTCGQPGPSSKLTIIKRKKRGN